MDLLEDFFNQYRYWIILALFIWFFLLWLTRWIRFEKKHWNSTALESYVDKSFPDNYEDEYYNPWRQFQKICIGYFLAYTMALLIFYYIVLFFTWVASLFFSK